MRYLLFISLATLSLASANPDQPQNRIIAQFFGYFYTLQGIQFKNMLTSTINFLEKIVQSVPEMERGPTSAAFQAYVNIGRQLCQRGTAQEKLEHVKRFKDLFVDLETQLNPISTEAKFIKRGLRGAFGVANVLAMDDAKLHEKLVEGANQMKAKLTKETLARESELFGVLDELINTPNFYENAALMERFKMFKNRY